VDIALRVRSLRKRGGTRLEPQGLVVRKLTQSQFVVCASPQYLKHTGVPRTPAELAQHSCVALVTTDHDVQTEWQFIRRGQRQNIKFTPKLLVHGTDGYREAGAAGCGIIRLLACHVEDELRSGKLVRLIHDWQSTWSPPIVAIYRKSRPMPLQIGLLIRHLIESMKRYDAADTNPVGSQNRIDEAKS
jgi:DNA-binding transcriptional LysR family regulator